MDSTAYNILRASRLLKYLMDKALKNKGVTAAQFSVLNQIAYMDREITSAEVAERVGADRPTLSGIIHRLEKAELVHRIENPKDRRAAFLGLTESGKAIIEEIRETADALTEEIFSVLSENELKVLENSILKVNRKMEENLK